MEMIKAITLKIWNDLWDDKLYKHEAAIIFVGGVIFAKIF